MRLPAARGPRRVLEILLLAGVVGAGGIAVHQLNLLLSRKMEELKERTIAVLENRLGHDIRYRSIAPSILGSLAVRDLTVFSLSDPERPLVRISRVKIYYDLFRLFSTHDPLQSLSEVQIANSSFEVDRERDQELLEFVERLRAGQGGGELPRLRLTGSNISLRYRDGDWYAAVQDLFFSIESVEDYYQVSIRGSLEYQRGQASGPLLATRVRVAGKVERSLAWSDLAVRVFSLSTNSLSLRRQTFQVTLSGRELKVNKIQDRAPLDLQITYDRVSRELGASFTMVKLRPADLVALAGPLARYNEWLGSRLTASGTFAYNLAARTLSYRADAELLPADELVPVDLYLVGHLRGTDKMIYLEPVVVHSPQGTIEFFGDVQLADRLPSGLLRLTEVRSPYAPALSASLEILREPGRVTVRGSRLELGEIALSAFSMVLSPAHGEIPFQLAASLPAEAGGIQAAGALSLGRQPGLRLETQARGMPLDILYYLLVPGAARAGPVAGRLASLNGSFDLSLATDFRTFSLSSEDIRLFERSKPENSARFALLATEGDLELRGLRAQWDGYALSGRAEARRTAAGLNLSGELEFENTPYALRGTYSKGGQLRLQGSYGLSVAVAFDTEGGLDLIPAQARSLRGTAFSLRTQEMPIPLKKGKVLLSTQLEGLLARGGALYARSPLTRLENYPFLAVKENSLQLGFSLTDRLLTLDSISYQDGISSVSGQGSLNLAGWPGAEGWVRLQDREGSERYSLAVDRGPDGLALLLEFNRTPLERAGELAVRGDLSGSLSLQGSLQEPILGIQLQLADGRLNADPLTAELAAAYRDHRLTLENLRLGLRANRLTEGRGYWDMALGELDFSSRFAADWFGKPTRLALEVKGTTAAGPLLRDAATAAALSRDVDAELRLSGIRVQDQQYPDWVMRLQVRGGELSLTGGPQEAVRAALAGGGQFSLELGAPLPIQGTAKGRLLRDRIEARFDLASLDMRIINTLLAKSTDIIQFTAGTSSGTLRIAGMVTDPDWFGTVEVRDAAMSFKFSPEPVQPINGQLIFNEKTFSLPRLATLAGRARVEAEGTFNLDHWIPRTFELSIYVPQYPGAHFKTTFAPVSLDGYGSGAVRVRGDEGITWVEGKVTANLCRIALVRTEEEVLPPARAAALSIDLKIDVGRGVEFFWPAQTFPVVHTYAKQGERVAVAVDGETGAVTLSGDVEIRGGEIFYFDRSFYLKRGSIHFDDALGEVDPWINALAEIRERDQNNEEITIYLEANNKLSQFSPRFYSEPARLDMDIMALIGGNIVDRFEVSSFGLSAVMLTSDIVGQFGILSPLERAVRRLLNLDLFSIRTQFLQNILIGKLVGAEAGSVSFNPLDNTTLTLGKYLGTDLFVQALVRFQATEAVGSAYNIQTEGELNLEWTTPFFLLEWTFTPRHPENLFLSDNSIGLSWKFLY